MVTVLDKLEIDEGNADFKRKIFSTVKTNTLSILIMHGYEMCVHRAIEYIACTGLEKIFCQGGTASIVNRTYNEFLYQKKAREKWGLLMVRNKGYGNFLISNCLNLERFIYDRFGKYPLKDKIRTKLHTKFFILHS